MRRIAGPVATLVTTLLIGLAPTAHADLPPLAGPVETIAAHARSSVERGAYGTLREELAKAIGLLARESDAKRLLAKVAEPTVALAIAQHELLAAAADELERISATPEGKSFMAELLGDRATLEEFFTTGAPPTDWGRTLAILQAIRASDSQAAASGEDALPRRLALAVALEHATPLLPWSEWDDQSAATIDPVKRYQFYRDLWSSRRLFGCFDELPTWELRRVVDLPLYDEDILWFHESMPERLPDGKAPLRSQAEIGNAAFLIPYRENSPTNGRSVQEGKPFYDGKRLTPAIMLEYGGVCGAVSKFGSFAARAFGVPAQPLGQEGHCALCWKHTPTAWRTANCSDESDWVTSNLHGLWGAWTTRGAIIPQMAAAYADPALRDSARAAMRAQAVLALGERDQRKRLLRELDLFERAAPPLIAWKRTAERLAAMEELRSDDLRKFAKGLFTAFADSPQVALDCLTTVETAVSFRALSQRDRERYAEDLYRAFADAQRDPKAFPGGERSLGLAFAELLGRAMWLTAGKTSSLGSWPYLDHLAVLNGTHAQWKEWWTGATEADRRRVTDLLAELATGLPKRPELAEQALRRLVTLAEEDESLRSRAQRAAESIAKSFTDSGRRDEALRVHRTMILAGERLGHRGWIRTFTERALELRGEPPASRPASRETGKARP
jgi:hypothetical protein